jgi:general secretion pathway protein K
MSRRQVGQRGYALLIVLWTLGLLALVGMRILATARQETRLASTLHDTALLQAAADGAVQRAIFATLDNSSQHWDADSLTRTVQVGRVAVAVRIDDETDKANPNLASPELLRALLLQCGADPGTAATVAAGIAEWRAAGAASGPPADAAARYKAAGRDYAPPGTPFASVDELGAVLGMTPELLARLRPHLTVLSDRDPNGSTHDPVVAQALSAVGQAGGEIDGAEPDLFSVTADAPGPDRAHYAIHVVVRTNAQAEGRHYRVLAHERLWNGMP